MNRINWPQIIEEIKATGISRYRLARLINASEGALRNWENGGSVRYEEGVLLLDLHANVTVQSNVVVESEPIA